MNILSKIIIILSLLISNMLFVQAKMPGEYIKTEEVHKIFKNINFRGSAKNGFYETYDIVSTDLEVDEIKFSIFDDDSKVLKWLEISIKTLEGDVTVTKILSSEGLLKGKIKRFQVKHSKYHPFEIDLSENKRIKENLSKDLLRNKDKTFKKGQKFIKEKTISISGKDYKVKIYRVKNKDEDIEYALLSDEDTKVLGIAYLKDKKGISIYLKALGENSLSIFPKKVPMLDLMSKMFKMSEGFMKDKEKREKALKREKELEAEDKKSDLDEDDPIKKLNKMLEKEGQ